MPQLAQCMLYLQFQDIRNTKNPPKEKSLKGGVCGGIDQKPYLVIGPSVALELPFSRVRLVRTKPLCPGSQALQRRPLPSWGLHNK